MSRAAASPHGAWTRLQPGAGVTVVKLAPDGSEAARYPGEIAAVRADGWIVVRATWTYRHLALDGLEFHPGDVLLEWFSPAAPFNAFAVSSPDGRFRGWYANVTHPARLDFSIEPPLLLWHDLYVDLIGLPDGAFTLRDDDELAASGLETSNPHLHAEILRARNELVTRFQSRLPPFTSPPAAPTEPMPRDPPA
jgi:hypothetical protein